MLYRCRSQVNEHFLLIRTRNADFLDLHLFHSKLSIPAMSEVLSSESGNLTITHFHEAKQFVDCGPQHREYRSNPPVQTYLVGCKGQRKRCLRRVHSELPSQPIFLARALTLAQRFQRRPFAHSPGPGPMICGVAASG